MTSFDPRSTLAAATRFFALAVVAPPCLVLAQPAAPSEAALLDIVEQIEAIQALHGETSADLIDPLSTLSLHYEERGEHALALALIDQVTHVMHVNHGLHSLDEAPLIQRSIRLEEARGNHEAAWTLEQELLALARRHREDPRTAPIFRHMADRRRALAARYEAGEFPPQIILGCYYSEPQWSNCRSGRRSRVISAIGHEARRFDAEAASVLARSRYLALLCTSPRPPETIAVPCP